MSLTRLLTKGLESAPEKVAVRAVAGSDGDGDWTYERLIASSRRLALGLRDLGLRPGDRVAFYLGNRIELVIAYLAVLQAGAVMVPMNLAYRRREIAHILADAEPRLLLTEVAHRQTLDELAEGELATVERVLFAEDLHSLELQDGDPAVTTVESDETAVIMYTSGTTGRSKGAVLSHANLVAAVESLLQAWAWSADDVLLLALPMFHTHGLVVGLHCALAAGATVRLHARFDAATVIEELSATRSGPRPTLFFGVPTMYGRLVQEMEGRAELSEFEGMRLFCSGSAPLPPDTFRDFERLTGHPILERYGMTETTMLLSNPYDGERRPGTVGTPLPGVSTRVVDADGRDLADGEEGELWVSGANVFAGYWRDAEKTERSFTVDARGRRWFHTGDLARRDPESGYFTLLGRRHELILSGGFNIYPREIEEVLTTYPGVREAAVVGLPHPQWGEAPAAFIVVDLPVDEELLIEHCKAQIASFKVPRRYVVVDSLPRNALGKIQKHLLPGV